MRHLPSARAAARCTATIAALIALAAATTPAHAQSWFLRWLARAEEWSLEENYRGWILHGAIAAGVTYAADRIADRPAYGAAIGAGFYLGKELREADQWGGFDLDRVMDMVTPVVGAVATAYLLRHEHAAPMPRVLPPPLPDPCAWPDGGGHADAPGPRRPDAASPWARPCLARAPDALDPYAPLEGIAHASAFLHRRLAADILAARHPAGAPGSRSSPATAGPLRPPGKAGTSAGRPRHHPRLGAPGRGAEHAPHLGLTGAPHRGEHVPHRRRRR